MGVYKDYVLPHIMNSASRVPVVVQQRQKVVPQASGVVLEIGIGPGLNLPFYDPEKVTKVIGLDPCEKSWKLAGDRAKAVDFDVEFIGLPGEKIPLENQSVDTVLTTLSLCTIPDPIAALENMARVLKPNGKLIFSEHGKAPDENILKWQNRLNSVWGCCFGGCHLNRNIPKLIESSGFSMCDLHEAYLPKTPRLLGYHYWGTAIVGN